MPKRTNSIKNNEMEEKLRPTTRDAKSKPITMKRNKNKKKNKIIKLLSLILIAFIANICLSSFLLTAINWHN